MSRLAERIKGIYADIDLFDAVMVRDDKDGRGEYIAHWADARPQPGEAELLAVVLI